MEPKGRLYAALLLAWLPAFGAEALRAADGALSLWRTTVRLEAAASVLRSSARENARLVDELRAQTRELEFLMSLPDRFPRERGYLRTQRAIAEDVQVLRREVGRRLRGSLNILIDAKANKLYVKKGIRLLWQADCSVGRGGVLTDKATGRRWEFVTPRGEFRIAWKGTDPVWNKPDWAFVEEHLPIPPPDDPSRKATGELGAYVLSLGDGYLIHGTKNEAVLGHPVSHGCVRLGAEDLKKLYDTVPAGTKVYIY